YAVGCGINSADIVKAQAAASLHKQHAVVLIPLIAETGAGGCDAENNGCAGTIGQAHWRSGNRHVIVHGQSRTTRDAVAATAADRDAVDSRVRSADIVQAEAAARLARQRGRAFVPLI